MQSKKTSKRKMKSVFRRFAELCPEFYIDRQWGFDRNIALLSAICSQLMPGPAIPIEIVTSFISDGIRFHDNSILWFSPSFNHAFWQYQ